MVRVMVMTRNIAEPMIVISKITSNMLTRLKPVFLSSIISATFLKYDEIIHTELFYIDYKITPYS